MTLRELQVAFDLGTGTAPPTVARNRRFFQVLDGLERIGFIDRNVVDVGPTGDTDSQFVWYLRQVGVDAKYDGELAWEIHAYALDVLQSLELSLSDTARSQEHRHQYEVHRLNAAISQLETMTELYGNRGDLVASVGEMVQCLHANCYIAVMALAGKVLEIVVKNRLNEAAPRQPPDRESRSTVTRRTFA